MFVDALISQRDVFAKKTVAFLRNTRSRHLLKPKTEVRSSELQGLDDAFAIHAFVLIGSGVLVCHAEPHRIVEQNRDLARGSRHRFGLTNAGGQSPIKCA
jgi:hypothetical protein